MTYSIKKEINVGGNGNTFGELFNEMYVFHITPIGWEYDIVTLFMSIQKAPPREKKLYELRFDGNIARTLRYYLCEIVVH